MFLPEGIKGLQSHFGRIYSIYSTRSLSQNYSSSPPSTNQLSLELFLKSLYPWIFYTTFSKIWGRALFFFNQNLRITNYLNFQNIYYLSITKGKLKENVEITFFLMKLFLYYWKFIFNCHK